VLQQLVVNACVNIVPLKQVQTVGREHLNRNIESHELVQSSAHALQARAEIFLQNSRSSVSKLLQSSSLDLGCDELTVKTMCFCKLSNHRDDPVSADPRPVAPKAHPFTQVTKVLPVTTWITDEPAPWMFN
jgi:hypothetical protein